MRILHHTHLRCAHHSVWETWTLAILAQSIVDRCSYEAIVCIAVDPESYDLSSVAHCLNVCGKANLLCVVRKKTWLVNVNWWKGT
jgi:hypothetical protein